MKLLSLVGARPQFVKLAPLCHALKASARRIRHVIVHSGQHYDYRMSKIFFDTLGIPKPDYNLGVGSGSHAEQTAECLGAFDAVLQKERPDWVLVYGDTNTTLAGALAAQKSHFRLAHVEAGLRSFNRDMPEETNRIVADHCADLLFCPTETAMGHLRREGFSLRPGRFPYAVNTGDLMFDVLRLSLPRADAGHSLLKTLGLTSKNYFLATVHRQSNTDDPKALGQIVSAFGALAQEVPVVWPVHPRTRKAMQREGLQPRHPNVRLTNPVGYYDMLLLEKHARKILTDSGGVQKEAYLLKVPCVTLREETEWTETLHHGWNRLVGVSTRAIVKAALSRVLARRHPSYFGDGRAAYHIVQRLLSA